MTQQPDAAAATATKPDAEIQPADVIGRMAALVGQAHYPRGDLAALRRIDPDRPHEPAFIRLMLDAEAPEAWTIDLLDARCWALIAHAMALMVPDHHAGNAWVGNALHEAKVSEARVARLLAARGVQFRAQIVRLARHLAQRGQPVNWRELGQLILAEGRGKTDVLDRHRLRIARAYYGAQYKSKTALPKDTS